MRLGLAREPEERGGDLELDDLQRAEDLELLDVFRQVAAGEPEMDELALGEVGELLDACLHVVQRHALALGDGGEVDLVLHLLVVLDGVDRDRHAEVALGLHHRDPEIALQRHAAVLRPDVLHRRRGVALGEDVGNGGGGVVHGKGLQ